MVLLDAGVENAGVPDAALEAGGPEGLMAEVEFLHVEFERAVGNLEDAADARGGCEGGELGGGNGDDGSVDHGDSGEDGAAELGDLGGQIALAIGDGGLNEGAALGAGLFNDSGSTTTLGSTFVGNIATANVAGFGGPG